MDLADVPDLAKTIGLPAISLDAGDIENAPPRYTVKFGDRIRIMLECAVSPVTFYNGAFERRLLGVVMPGVSNNADLMRVSSALAAYSVGRVVYFDGKQYPAKLLFVLPFPTRDNIINFVAVHTKAGDPQIGDSVKAFFEQYRIAWNVNNHLDETVCGHAVTGTPIGFLKQVFSERHTRKYGGPWKIPGFGPDAAEYVRKLFDNTDTTNITKFIEAVTE